MPLEPSSPKPQNVSLIGEGSSCLLDVFSCEKLNIFRLVKSFPRRKGWCFVSTSRSIAIDLDGCLNVENLTASFTGSFSDDIQVWG